jgi:hypothetical protein
MLFSRFPIITPQTFENNDCFKKTSKDLKKISLENNLNETTSQEELINSSSINGDLIMETVHDVLDEMLEEIQHDQQETPELDVCLDEDNFHQISDVNFEDNHQFQNIFQEFYETDEFNKHHEERFNELISKSEKLQREINDFFKNSTDNKLKPLSKFQKNLLKIKSRETPKMR